MSGIKFNNGMWENIETHIADKHSPGYALAENEKPRFTLCQYNDNEVFITGDGINDSGTQWVFDWLTGESIDAAPSDLIQTSTSCVDTDEFLEKFKVWASTGNTYAMMFLSWYYNGINHPRSTWYMIALMRSRGTISKDTFEAFISNSWDSSTCKGVPKPCLEYLNNIFEFNSQSLSKDWEAAILNAEIAIHTPANDG
jgi:hypothetical protein